MFDVFAALFFSTAAIVSIIMLVNTVSDRQ